MENAEAGASSGGMGGTGNGGNDEENNENREHMNEGDGSDVSDSDSRKQHDHNLRNKQRVNYREAANKKQNAVRVTNFDQMSHKLTEMQGELAIYSERLFCIDQTVENSHTRICEMQGELTGLTMDVTGVDLKLDHIKTALLKNVDDLGRNLLFEQKSIEAALMSRLEAFETAFKAGFASLNIPITNSEPVGSGVPSGSPSGSPSGGSRQQHTRENMTYFVKNAPKFEIKDKRNPVLFLESFVAYCMRNSFTADLKFQLFLESVRVDRDQWILDTVALLNFEEAKSLFLSTYWSRKRQEEVYAEFRKVSFADLPVTKIKSEVKAWINVFKNITAVTLDTRLSVRSTVKKLPKPWQDLMLNSTVNTFEALLEHIDRFIENDVSTKSFSTPRISTDSNHSHTKPRTNVNAIGIESIITESTESVPQEPSSNTGPTSEPLVQIGAVVSPVPTGNSFDELPGIEAIEAGIGQKGSWGKKLSKHVQGHFNLPDSVGIVGDTIAYDIAKRIDSAKEKNSSDEKKKYDEFGLACEYGTAKYILQKVRSKETHKECILLSIGYSDMANTRTPVIDFVEYATNLVEILLRKGVKIIVFVMPPVHPFSKQNQEVFIRSCEIRGELLRLTALYGIQVVNIDRLLFRSDSSVYDSPCDGTGMTKFEIFRNLYFYNRKNAVFHISYKGLSEIIPYVLGELFRYRVQFEKKKLESVKVSQLAESSLKKKKLSLFEIREFRPCSYTAQVSINRIKVSQLVDIGAEISVMTQEFLEHLRRLVPDSIEINDIEDGPTMTTVSGTEQQKILCMVNVKTKLTSVDEVWLSYFVVHSLTFPIILGADNMGAYINKIHLDTCKIEWNLDGKKVFTPMTRRPELSLQCRGFGVNSLRLTTKDGSTITSNTTETEEYYHVESEIKKKLQKAVAVNGNFVSESDAQTALEYLRPYFSLFIPGLGKFNKRRVSFKVQNASPWKAKNYPIPNSYRNAVDNEVEKLLEQGVIQVSDTPYVNPLVVVMKKDGTIRLCIDASALNKILVPVHHDPLTVEQVLLSEGSTNVNSSFDMAKGYWQLELDEEVRKYLGFTVNGITYVFTRLPFGTSVSSGLFVEVMNEVLRPIRGSHLIDYVDDVFIKSVNFRENLNQVLRFLDVVKSAGMKLSLEKTSLFMDSVNHLGFKIGQNVVKKDFEKVKKLDNLIDSWPVKLLGNGSQVRYAKTQRQIRQLIGFCNFYSLFIPNYNDLMSPFFNLLKKENTKFDWGDREVEALGNLRAEFIKEVVLHVPNSSHPFQLYISFHENSVSAVLCQIDMASGAKRLIMNASHPLKKSQMTYTDCEKEVFALSHFIKRFNLIIAGRELQISSSYQTLINKTRQFANLHRKMGYWLTMINTCSLSCVLGDESRMKRVIDDLEDGISVRQFSISSVLAPVEAFTFSTAVKDSVGNSLLDLDSIIAGRVRYFGVEMGDTLYEALTNVKHHQSMDPKVSRIISALTSEIGTKNYRSTFEIRDGILMRKIDRTASVVVLPKYLGHEVTRYLHTYYGHPGAKRLAMIANRYFWWFDLERSIRREIGGCMSCNLSKASNKKITPEFAKVKSAKIGGLVSFDMFGPLPISRGGVSACVVAKDLCSGYTWAYPIKKATAEIFVQKLKFVKNDLESLGYKIENVLSDNGVQFRSMKWSQFCSDNGIVPRYTATYNPCSNPVERTMRELGNKLRIHLNLVDGRSEEDSHRAWALAVRDVVGSINDTPNRHGLTPCQIVGREPHEQPFERVGVDAVDIDIRERLRDLKVEIERLRENSVSVRDLKKLYESCRDEVSGQVKSNKIENDKNVFIYDPENFVLIYTDGACLRNGREDSKGAIGIWFNESNESNVSEIISRPHLTNNQCELEAIKRALEVSLDLGIKKIAIVSDSEYAIIALRDRVPGWILNGWRNSKKQTVKNSDIFLEIYDLSKKFDEVEWRNVQGHCDDFGNHSADLLATRPLVLSGLQGHEYLQEEPYVEEQDDVRGITCRRVNYYERYNVVKTLLSDLTREVKYNKSNPDVTIFKVGERVKVISHPLSSKAYGFTKKLAPKYEGPYVVVKQLGSNLYLIKPEDDEFSYKTVNVRQLRPFTGA